MSGNIRLLQIQKQLSEAFGCMIDLYIKEGVGLIAVRSGMNLHPENVLYFRRF